VVELIIHTVDAQAIPYSMIWVEFEIEWNMMIAVEVRDMLAGEIVVLIRGENRHHTEEEILHRTEEGNHHHTEGETFHLIEGEILHPFEGETPRLMADVILLHMAEEQVHLVNWILLLTVLNHPSVRDHQIVMTTTL